MLSKVSSILFALALASAMTNVESIREGLTVRHLSIYRNGRCFLSDDHETGFTVTDQNELISLFNWGRPGNGKLAVAQALREGATWLECDAALIPFYEACGFAKTERTVVRMESIIAHD